MDIRNRLIETIEEEVVGPAITPKYKDDSTGEELLLLNVHGSPKTRYGAGMLYPQQNLNCEIHTSDGDTDIDIMEDGDNETTQLNSENRNAFNTENGESEDEPVGLANQYFPSAMGFTVRFRSNERDSHVTLKINSAYYEKGVGKKVVKRLNKDGQLYIPEYKGKPLESDYWIRRPIKNEPILLDIYNLFSSNRRSFETVVKESKNGEAWLKLRIFNRTTKIDIEHQCLTYTFVLVNDLKATTDNAINSNQILYQNSLVLETGSNNLIAPYQEKQSAGENTMNNETLEEQEMNLLYRKKRIYAIGHGASVSWEMDRINGKSVNKVETAIIPTYDLLQVAPTVDIELSMLALSDLGDWEKAKESLRLLVSEYSKWIDSIENQAQNAPELAPYRSAALTNIAKCKSSLKRISKGVDYLLNADLSTDVVKCFRWMNRAMMWQQQRSKTKLRKWTKTVKGSKTTLVLDGIEGKREDIEFLSLGAFHNTSKYNGRWRPFQLAFILMNIESVIDTTSKERKIVDLIWFPTGGGKTEAYLGLTAFNIFYRRIKGKEKQRWKDYGGTSVIMRYTLRLLTTQQYERASSLICACDLIRKENRNLLGSESISIGLWVGSQSTPNKNKEARAQLNKLRNDSRADYNFVVMKCPCCGAQIGKVEGTNKYDKERIKGIQTEEGKNGAIIFQCENSYCEYAHTPLPLQVVDELIYNHPPTLLLGTVDKFAMIPWKKETGHLFGFREKNNKWRRINPPELIIQDELHLIAGPLGTMVGLYETMIQTLCNNYNKNRPPFITTEEDNFIIPKIVASSATISRAFEQVQSLYGIETNEQLNIFPAQGLSFGNTWFSEEKPLSEKFPGRKYVGILGSGYPSMQTMIVRTYAAILQKIKELTNQQKEEELNYYWTLLGYFNSIRELGGASSLVYGDIRERLGQIHNRDLIQRKDKRYVNKIEELTSRISSTEIPATLKKLEEDLSVYKNKALDICLATNMVATGVDISRLGLMFIHGQPKTTAEYIQASSRVGRKVPQGPGIIFTLYSPSKPRDKSQYEQFQGYHSRIYSKVEPTSVTPFSINARERAIHAVIIGLIRHFSKDSLRTKADTEGSPQEFRKLAGIVSKIILDRCTIIDENEVTHTEKLIQKRISFWQNEFDDYGDAFNSQIKKDSNVFPLMYSNSTEFRESVLGNSLSTPTSMRGVDTESSIKIHSKNIQDVE